jgi:hypothetical protein
VMHVPLGRIVRRVMADDIQPFQAGRCQVSEWVGVGLGFVYPARAAAIPL